MLRLQANGGWWLVTHPDHARLAGAFASRWGNDMFVRPEPRTHVLHGINAHDDGWTARDALPLITREGRPAAFSTDLVGTYSAFEEIDLGAYLAVRREAVQLIAMDDAYAAILISSHTVNLLTARADRRSIRAEHLPWLDAFLVEQLTLQRALREQLLATGEVAEPLLTEAALRQNFELLQACDNLSLLSCVDYAVDATLLWPFLLRDGSVSDVHVSRVGQRRFQLTPYPFEAGSLTFRLPAKFISGETFASDHQLQELYARAPLEELAVSVTA